MKEDSKKVSAADRWFERSLKALLGGEIACIERGKKKNIDREMLAKWIQKNLIP